MTASTSGQRHVRRPAAGAGSASRRAARRGTVGLLLGLAALLGLSVAESRAVVLCNVYGCYIVGGPASPGSPHTDRGMRASAAPRRGPIGTFFHAHASGFRPGEYVTVWSYEPGHRAHFLPNVRRASRTGERTAGLHTFAGIDRPGLWHLCFKGLTTGRVACASFRATGASGLHATPPPGQGSGPGSGTGSGSGSGTGSGPGSGGSGGGCAAWNVGGAWSWVAQAAGGGPGSGPATLEQRGASVTGTIKDTASGGLWSLSGSVSGSTLTLTMTAPPGLAGGYRFVGTVSATRITGSDYGDFTSGYAHCSG